MQGIPQFNFPAFFAAAEVLRRLGYEVVSPAEIDDKDDNGKAMQSATGQLQADDKTWGDFLSRDVKLIADGGIEGIVFLPNWHRSKGARLEAYVGLLKGVRFFEFTGDDTHTIPAAYVAGVCAAQWMPEEVRNLASAGPATVAA